MTEASLVDLVNTVAFVLFWLFLFVAAGTTLARVAYYRVMGYRRPRLLTRDAVLVGGFALSFGLILFVRTARAFGVDVGPLGGSLVWSLVTATPAVVALGTYLYFELFVIEKGGDRVRDRTYEMPEDPDERDEP